MHKAWDLAGSEVMQTPMQIKDIQMRWEDANGQILQLTFDNGYGIENFHTSADSELSLLRTGTCN